MVIVALPPSPLSSAICAKLSRMMPTNRFRMKKLARIMKTMKKNAIAGLWSRSGASSGERESTPSYITAVHPSVVDISNSVRIALKMLSKL